MTVPTHIMQWQSVVMEADLSGLDVPTVLAIIWKETEADGSQYSHRIERLWQYFWNIIANAPMFDVTLSVAENRAVADQKLPVTEFWDQSSSWGLMQVMGAVGREHGYKGWLPGLCDPVVNIEYGCKHLARCLRQAGGDLWGALRIYNGSKEYATDVLKKIMEVKQTMTALV